LSVGGSILNTGSGSFIARNGKVILNASSGTKYVNLGTSTLNNVDVSPASGVIYQLISSDLTTTGNINITAGTLDLNGRVYNMGDGSGSDFMSVTGGTLIIGANATLKMGNLSNLAINNGAVFRLVGSTLGLANVAATSGSFGITINSGATLHAKRYSIANLNASGLYVRAGATIDATNNLSDGYYSNGAAGGTFIQLENTFTSFTADSVEFNSGPAFNCIRTIGTGEITFSDPTGTLGNFSFEKDELAFNASLGLIRCNLDRSNKLKLE
jgi:hypothetical protein